MEKSFETIATMKQKWCANDDGNTVLHFAAAFGSNDLVLEYLSKGADINAVNFMEWTPLMQAARNGCTICVKTLIEKGCDVLLKNKYGISAFTLACANGDLESVNIIFKKIIKLNILPQDLNDSISPLAIASLFEHQSIIRYLTMNEFDINATTIHTGLTPLMFAGAVNNEKVISTLLKYKPNTALYNINGLNCMQMFLENKSEDSKMAFYTKLNSSMNAPDIVLTDTLNNQRSYSSSSDQEISFPSFLSPIPCVLQPPNTPILHSSTEQVFFPSNFPSPSHIISSQFDNSNSFLVHYVCDGNNYNSLLNRTIYSTFGEFSPMLASSSQIFFPFNSLGNVQFIAPSEVLNSCQRIPKRHGSTSQMIESQETKKVKNRRFSEPNAESGSSLLNTNMLKLISLLQKNKLGTLIPLFMKQEIDYNLFIMLSDSELVTLGVTDNMQREKINELISDLRNRKKI